MIRADGLTAISADGQRLDAVTFAAARGETVGIIGAARSGSALLLQVLATLAAPAGGRLLIGGIDAVARPFDVRRHVYWVGTPVMDADLSIREYVGLVRAGRRVGLTPGTHDAALEDLGLRETLHLRALSAGQRQLVDIILATRSGANLLLLDRPARALGRDELPAAARILERARAGGLTILMTADASHELPAGWDRLLAMEAGRLTALPPAPAPAPGSSAAPGWSAR